MSSGIRRRFHDGGAPDGPWQRVYCLYIQQYHDVEPYRQPHHQSYQHHTYEHPPQSVHYHPSPPHHIRTVTLPTAVPPSNIPAFMDSLTLTSIAVRTITMALVNYLNTVASVTPSSQNPAVSMMDPTSIVQNAPGRYYGVREPNLYGPTSQVRQHYCDPGQRCWEQDVFPIRHPQQQPPLTNAAADSVLTRAVSNKIPSFTNVVYNTAGPYSFHRAQDIVPSTHVSIHIPCGQLRPALADLRLYQQTRISRAHHQQQSQPSEPRSVSGTQHLKQRNLDQHTKPEAMSNEVLSRPEEDNKPHNYKTHQHALVPECNGPMSSRLAGRDRSYDQASDISADYSYRAREGGADDIDGKRFRSASYKPLEGSHCIVTAAPPL
ncbi:hypothetical protein KCU71_g788, partial [Aureobasidium melanogenum]